MKSLAASCVLTIAALMPTASQAAASTPFQIETYALADSTLAPAPDDPDAADYATNGDSIVQRAMRYLGARYRYGHTGPYTFDCSGFTSYVYGKEGIKLSRTSRTQSQQGKIIRRIADLQKGDLVFFGSSRAPRSIGHVGIVTEVDPETNRFKFIHASSKGVQVTASTASYYDRRYLGARRILQTDKE